MNDLEANFRRSHAACSGDLEERRSSREPTVLELRCPADRKTMMITIAEDLLMPRPKSKVDVQPELVQLTEEEIAEHTRQLPIMIGDLAEMKERHRERAKADRTERRKLEEATENIAQRLRQQGR